MPYTIAQLKVDWEGALHGTSLSKINNPDSLIARAGRELVADVDLRETKRISQITNALYDQVYRYVVPSDVKGNKIIDIRPQANRKAHENPSQTYQKEFDLYRTSETFAIEQDDANKYLTISKDLLPGILINECDSITANGTYTGGSGASNITLDTVYYVTGSGSINFDITSATTPYVEVTGLDSVDLSDHDEKSSLFRMVYLPTVTNLSSIALRWGNDSSNYWTRSVTANFDSTSFQVGWNLLRFDWNGATETGTVDPAAIDYERITFTFSSSTTQTDFRIDSLYSKLPSIYEIVYYSRFIFRTTSGTWGETVTSDDDIINLETDAYNLLFNKLMILSAPQIQGKNSAFDVTFYKDEYKAGVEQYKRTYKSEAIKPSNYYYRV